MEPGINNGWISQLEDVNAPKQGLYNIRATIVDRFADILGELKKVIILEKTR